MKKIIFYLIATVALFSCNSFESKVTKVDDTFESFTVLSTDGDTLTGLRKTEIGFTVVDPGPFTDFKVIDGQMITCVNTKNNSVNAYSLMGMKLTENPIDSITKDDSRFICYHKDGKVIFFAEDDDWVDCKLTFTTNDYLFCRTQENTWEIYAKETNDKVISKNRDITVVKNIKNKEKVEDILIIYEMSGEYRVIDMNNENVAILTPKDLKRFEKKFKNSKTLDGNSRYAEVEGFVI